jgi:hypothetical protein
VDRARGRDGHFVVKRLKDRSALTPATLQRMRTIGDQYRGKSYDLYFEWSDARIYCSELVWKIYQRGAGVEIGRLQALRNSISRTQPSRAKMRERYGNQIPKNEPVISPAAMFDSTVLYEVMRR